LKMRVRLQFIVVPFVGLKRVAWPTAIGYEMIFTIVQPVIRTLNCPRPNVAHAVVLRC
jgi:hypothetical protein